jgi:amidase
MADGMKDADGIIAWPLSLGGQGPRVVVKDSIDVADAPTRCGSAVFADAPPAPRNAAIVDHLIAGGARLIGKATLHEFAYGVTGINPWGGTPPNPRHPGRIPGGSSSGSAAAVAAGIAEIGIGTDTGGSIRMPAVCCGVFGLKPSFGRVSREGVMLLHSSLDCVGPLARDMAGIVQGMALIDPDFRLPEAKTPATIGLVTVDADPAIIACVREALERAGVAVHAVTLPSMQEAHAAGLTIIAAEAFAAFGAYRDDPRVGADIRARLADAAAVGPDALAAAEKMRARFLAEVDRALTVHGLLALPALPVVPPKVDDAADARTLVPLTRLLRPFNLSGHPALAIPLTLPDGAPAGLQIVAARGADEMLCAAGLGVAA